MGTFEPQAKGKMKKQLQEIVLGGGWGGGRAGLGIQDRECKTLRPVYFFFLRPI